MASEGIESIKTKGGKAMTTTNIENVTLSLPNTDLAMLRLLSRRMGWKLSATPMPCQYTVEEAVQRALKATDEAEKGEGCLTLDEFEALVETW